MSQFDSLDKLQEKFSGKYPGEANGIVTLDSNARIASDQEASTGGTAPHKLMGVIDSQFTEVGNVGAGEDDLMTYTLPANTLDADGKVVRVTAWGSGNGIDNVTVKFHFGTSEKPFIVGVTTLNWWAQALIVRSGVGTQEGTVPSKNGTSGDSDHFAVLAEDETGAIEIKFTGENTSDVSDDAVTQLGMLVEILN